MFVNLLEWLQFVYLIKYCFIKRQAGSHGGRATCSAAPGGQGDVRGCGHPACPSVCPSDGPCCPSTARFNSIL